MSTALASPGPIIREWRARRRMSQLDLAMEAEISQRHLSFVESGRAKPSREMVLHLAERLDLPLRETNRLLLAAGYAPGFVERKLDDPSMAPALEAVERVLAGHDPNPAVAVDRHWNLVRTNAALAPLKSFVLPGGSPAAAHLHLARTVCRRAERIMVALRDQPGEHVSEDALRYVNRLSDLLFVASRAMNDNGAADVLWAPGQNR